MTASVLQLVGNAPSGSATTITQSITTSVTAIIEVCTGCNNGETVTGVSDGSAYTQNGTLNGTAGSRRGYVYRRGPVAPGTYNVVTTFSGSIDSRFSLLKEIGDVSGFDKYAAAVQATPGTSTDATSSGNTAALAGQPSLVSGWCLSTQYSGATDTFGTGYTNNGTAVMTNANMAYVGESKRVTATTAVAATATSAANFEHLTFVSTYRENVAGTGKGTRNYYG